MSVVDDELFRLTQEQYDIAFNTFSQRTRQGQERSLMCDIYEVFARPGESNHNCLGCNFDDMTEQIANFLLACKQEAELFSIHQSFSIYALLLNSLWERITDVFDIICLPLGYRVRHFEVSHR